MISIEAIITTAFVLGAIIIAIALFSVFAIGHGNSWSDE